MLTTTESTANELCAVWVELRGPKETANTTEFFQFPSIRRPNFRASRVPHRGGFHLEIQVGLSREPPSRRSVTEVGHFRQDVR
jgi:hypothetical protein